MLFQGILCISGGEGDLEDLSDEIDQVGRYKIAQKKAKLTSTIEFLDQFLIVWHAAFLILCLVLVGVGIILRAYTSNIIEQSVKSSKHYMLYSAFVKIENVPKKLQFGELTNVLGNSLIVLNGVYAACVFCYMTILLHKLILVIPLVVILSGSVILIEVNIINIYMSPVSAANENAKKELKDKTQKEYRVYSDTPFSVTYDIISIWGHCCGIVDQYDFQNTVLVYHLPTRKEQKTLLVPPTCCTPQIFEKGMDDVIQCATKVERVFKTGCYEMIYQWLRSYCNKFSIVVMLQLLDLFIHTILYKKHLNLMTIDEIKYIGNN